MFVEERIYTFCSGQLPLYLQIYEDEGMAIQMRHLPAMVGYYYTEIGPLNTLVHMWAYEDLNQRTECRAQLWKDPAWGEYLKRVLPLFQNLESRILSPAPFFEARAKAMLRAGHAGISVKTESSKA